MYSKPRILEYLEITRNKIACVALYALHAAVYIYIIYY